MRRIFWSAVLAGIGCMLAPAVKADPDAGWQAAVARYYARSKECWARYEEHRLRTFTAATNCEDGGLVDSLSQAGYPHMDLVRVIVAEHLVIAERVDKKKITFSEGMAARAELESRIVAELQRRDLMMRRAEQDAAEASARARAQSEAAARAQAREEAQARMLEEMQAQATAEAEAARRAQALDLAGRLLAPQYVSPARTYPSQTICQRVGPQLICNSN